MSFLLVFISPILYIFLSAAVLSNFKIAYHFLARASYQRSGNAVWQAVQPILAKQMEFLEQVFGPPATFTPSVTHVMLVAIMMIMIVYLKPAPAAPLRR